jgi:hypothetical protein
MDRKDSYGVERVYIVQDPLGDLLLVRRPEVWIKEASTMHGSMGMGTAMQYLKT